jgi:hypothetical protein
MNAHLYSLLKSVYGSKNWIVAEIDLNSIQ